jgi:hypothetical protein
MRYYFRIFAWILVVGAVLLLARAGYAVYEWNERIKIYEITQGVVVEVAYNADSTQFFPVISFRAADNQKLRIRSRQADASVHVGDSVQVLYDIANPDDMLPVHLHPVQNNGVWVSSAALLLMIGLTILFRQWQQHNHRQLLQASGKTLRATYASTEVFSLFGFHFYRAKLVAKISHPQEQELHFTSEWFTEDPALYWQGKSIQVHINMSRESDYWVNTELLPSGIRI